MNYLKLLLSKSQHSLLTPKDGAHSLLDDTQGLVTGVIMMALGIIFFQSASLYTGGVTGLALVVHYWSGTPLGWVLMLINIPFYIIAYFHFGKSFTIKSLVAITLLSIFVSIMEEVISIQSINTYFAAIMGGLLIGIGLIFLFRHRSSTGGFNVLVLYLQDKRKWNAGLVQMVLDFGVISLSIFSGSSHIIIASFLGAAVMNLTISVNHRPGRYISF